MNFNSAALARLARNTTLHPRRNAGNWQHIQTWRRGFRTSIRLYDDKPDERPEQKISFMGQLYASTWQRLERERANERRLIRTQEAREDKTARRTGLTTLTLLFIGGIAYWLGAKSPKKLPTTSTTPLGLAQPPEHDVRRSNLQAAWTDLAVICGKDNISTTEDDLVGHSGSEWSSYITKPHEKPFMIAYPASTTEVAKIMKICHKRKIPVTAISGGTSLEGHFAPTRGGVCIDLGRMDKIVDFHPKDLDVTVQPAVGWQDLNEELKEHGLFFPPDPGPGAMIGGMVGTGCSGTNAFRYGTMREWVISLTVVLADGTVIKTRQRPRKSSAGYDLTKMFIGSEGTLGIVTEAVLKVTVLPKSTSVAVATFPDIHSAAECVSAVVAEGVQVAGVEVLDDVQMRAINQSGTTNRKWSELPTLFFKFAGTKSGVKEQIDIVKRVAKANRNQKFEFARNSEEADELWSARKEALWSMMALRRDENDHVWTTDVAVPISRLPDIIKETKDDLSSNGILAGIVGHVGDGNFHCIVLFNEAERKTVEDLIHRMVKRAIEMEGTATGEHGVGLVKRDVLPHELGQTTVDAMRRLKQAYDPMCLLNCDKIVRVEPPAKGEVHEW